MAEAAVDLEKYQLVLLIVGSTVCVVVTWLIVDFCLYRRDRRAKRQKNDDLLDSLPNKTRMLIPYTKDSSIPTTTQVAVPKRRTSFRKFLNFFSIKKIEENENETIEEGKRSKSLDEDSPNEKPLLRRFTEIFSNKVSNLNDSKVSSKEDHKDTCLSSDRENVESADSGNFSEGRRDGETKWNSDLYEADGGKYDTGFNDFEEEGMRVLPQKKKSKKKKNENPKKTFSLLHHRYI
ncbi:uncharacterized protein LOC125663777 [Ostrea edulis]|uniref:uncharacterized protein LOC125663777 n=1 Tax=Ostrea edulis TaxID=37623 RepID=UPI0020958071|nr:uncharacterized protein LOC125663777 [Ostrea edulis]